MDRTLGFGKFPRAVLGLMVLLLSAGSAPSAEQQPKIDPALLGRIPHFPIFVRMTDQLIGQAGEYEKFCDDHRRQKRKELRALVIKTLRQKSDTSWKQIANDVDRLVRDGRVRNVQRFWIVNGFSCEATEKAIEQLSACDPVAFVYLDRNPPARGKPVALAEDQKQVFKEVLKEWKDDSEEPFSTEGLEVPWNLQRIQADAAWKEEKITGKGVVVAVCDSGLMYTCPSLVRALWKNPKEELDGKDRDGNGYTDDLFGYDFQANSAFVLGDASTPHGSMCAGIIAGRPLNSKKLITGVAPRCRVMILRGDGLKTYEYALANGADVLSMSYGIPGKEIGDYRGLYRTAFEHLAAAGVVASGGVGNHFKDLPKTEQIVSPKDVPCVMGTAGIMENGEHGSLSSQGPCFWEGVKFYSDYPKTKPLQKPDVTAPFGGYPLWARPHAPGEDWKVLAKENDWCALVIGPVGNSFSCPHTAGVAALMLSANPDLNAWEVKQLMEQTCKDLGNKKAYGAGLLQARDAVRAAKKVRK
jgi:hypothetical protein